MGEQTARKRMSRLRPRRWVALVTLGLAFTGWVVLLFFDPAGSETARVVAVWGAIALGFPLGMAFEVPIANAIAKVLGPLWRAIIIVTLWVPLNWMLLVAVAQYVIPASFSSAPVLTFTAGLLIIGFMVTLIVPFMPVRSIYTGTKHGKNAFEWMKSKQYWRYFFMQYLGFFWGAAYIGACAALLGIAIAYPTGEGW